MTEYSSQEVISETKINSELKRIRTTARQLLFCAQYMTDKTVPENKKPRYNSNAEITQAFWEHKDDVYMHEYDRLGINLFHGTTPMNDGNRQTALIISFENRHAGAPFVPHMGFMDSPNNHVLYAGEPTRAGENTAGELSEATIMEFSRRFDMTVSLLGLDEFARSRSKDTPFLNLHPEVERHLLPL